MKSLCSCAWKASHQTRKSPPSSCTPSVTCRESSISMLRMLPALYQQMAAKANGGMSSNVNYATLNQHLGLVKAYADEISAQLAR